MTSSNVYLLVYSDLSAFKAGKSNCVERRVEQLSRDWGYPNYKESFQVTVGNEKDALELERSLHFFLEPHSIDVGDGDGKSEFFSLGAIEYAKGVIDHFSKARGTDLKVLKGMKINSHLPWYLDAKEFKLNRKKSLKSTIEAINNIDKLHRLLFILNRKESTIPFARWETKNEVGIDLIIFSGSYTEESVSTKIESLRVIYEQIEKLRFDSPMNSAMTSFPIFFEPYRQDGLICGISVRLQVGKEVNKRNSLHTSYKEALVINGYTNEIIKHLCLLPYISSAARNSVYEDYFIKEKPSI